MPPQGQLERDIVGCVIMRPRFKKTEHEPRVGVGDDIFTLPYSVFQLIFYKGAIDKSPIWIIGPFNKLTCISPIWWDTICK